MNNQYFGERVDPSEIVEEANKDMDNLVEKVDSYDDAVPEQAAPVVETLVDGPLTNEVAKNEARVQGFPMDETVPYKTPVSETIAAESDVIELIPHQTPVDETITHEVHTGTNAELPAALIGPMDAEHFRTRWNEIQGKFVDEPRTAVQQADVLVSEVIEQIAQRFATEHSSLEGQWNQGNDVSTEDLRKALQHYRTFFNRLVFQEQKS